MILEQRPSSGNDTAFAGRATIDQILRRLAATKGDQLALADAPDRSVFTDGPPRRLTWAELNAETEKFARCLAGFGLQGDSVVVLQLPNTVESIIAFLSIIRAGMIAAPVPLAWRRRELSWAMQRTAAAAAVTVVRSGPVAHAGVVSRAAAENFDMRFVCAFGEDVPDGVLALHEAMEDDSWPELTPDARDGNPGDHIAVVTFDATSAGFVPVPRSHNTLIVAGMAHLVEARIEGEDAIVTTLPASSLAGLATGVMTALLSGAGLYLHQTFNGQALSGAIAATGAAHVVLPGLVADALGSSRLPHPPLRGITAVRRDPCEVPGTTLAGLSRTEFISFGEIGFLSRRRDHPIGTLLAGRIPVSKAAPNGMLLAETRLREDGVLEISGPIAPDGEFPGRKPEDAALMGETEGFYPMGWSAQPRNECFAITPGRRGVTSIGGISLPTRSTLEAIREALDGAADPKFIADGMFGSRLWAGKHAVRLREAGFTAALTGLGDDAPVQHGKAETTKSPPAAAVA
ncbi:hypothetical protein GCM10007276_23860 [Agaricicola taiwanensis]|uniref:AMP-dependent synthetase/ligase domain-containing protein n=1 Tax=Agaricicola taiwanensis TaxID=591372 RepID=A0A8J2YIP9_9RHOB|nr:class I adenylate-forming enzyme family protein [Agaricicola taiwanensis]GGE45849.1 hypothetical protein GCM10007276_23860 [Agaricicola taiwanensis]